MNQRSPEAALITIFDGAPRDRLADACAKMHDGSPMSPDKLIGQAISAMKKNRRLAQCNPASIAGAIFEAASLGLWIDGVSGEAYLVPYRDSCQLQIGFRGYVKLAYQSGRVSQFAAHPVFEADEFDYEYGTEQFIKHRPSEDESRGNVVASWAMISTVSGGKDFEVMTWADIAKIRDNSPSYSFAESGPSNRGGGKKDSTWHKHLDQMASKSAIRRLAKRVPLSTEFVRASSLDAMAEAGVAQKLDALVPDLPELPPPVEPVSEEKALRDSLPPAEGENWDDDDDVDSLFPEEK